MNRSMDELFQIVGYGGGLDFDASTRPTAELLRIAANASRWRPLPSKALRRDPQAIDFGRHILGNADRTVFPSGAIAYAASSQDVRGYLGFPPRQPGAGGMMSILSRAKPAPLDEAALDEACRMWLEQVGLPFWLWRGILRAVSGGNLWPDDVAFIRARYRELCEAKQ